MRKFLALVLALVMTMSLVTVSAGAATDFTDDAKIVNTEAVEVLNAMGILGGYDDGSFRPQATLTRGAGAKMIAYLMLGQTKADKLTATYTVFEDVTDSVGLAPYIEWAAANGIVDGYGNGNFGPYNLLTEYAFGKMLLTALNYDPAVEGYTGAGWQKNVYRDATYAGIYDGTEAYGACTRDTAARMVLGALKANIVAYGNADVAGEAIYWNGIMLGTGFSVEGRIETGIELWETYEGLDYIKLGVDTFGRPGHKWTYSTTFEKFYMDTPVAEYTTATTDCQVLVDFGVAKTSKSSLNIYEFTNGVLTKNPTAHQHSAACATAPVGGQGVLTQLFKVGTSTYIVTEIDTYLATVDKVTTTNHNTIGDTFMTAYVDKTPAVVADTADNTTPVPVGTYGVIGYNKGDKVLINLSNIDLAATGENDDNVTIPAFLETAPATGTDPKDDYKKLGLDVYALEAEDKSGDYTYMNVVGAPSVISTAKFNGVAADKSVATVNGIDNKVAKHYELSVSNLDWANAGKYYNFYVDQYNNLIGDSVVINPFTYGVIQDLAYAQQLAPTADYVHTTLVKADASVNYLSMYQYNGLAVAEQTHGKGAPNVQAAPVAGTKVPVSQYSAQNDDFYYYTNGNATALGVVKVYELATGGYNMVPVVATDDNNFVDVVVNTANDAAITKNNPNLVGTASAVADEDTVFVVKYTGLDGKAAYASYTGINNVPSMKNARFTAVYEDATGAGKFIAAAFVFVDVTNGYFVDTAETVLVTAAGLVYNKIGDTYSYKVYADGAEKTVRAASNALFSTTGLWELRYNADGFVTEVALLAELTPGNYANYVWDGTKNGSDFAGDATLSPAWIYSAVADGIDTGVVELVDATYYTTGAKVIVVKYNDLNTNNNYDGADTVKSVALGGVNDLITDADAKVIYKLKTGTAVIDTIVVMVEHVEY